MTKEVLAVDVDDVLFPYVPEFLDYDNPRHDGDLTIDKFHCYRFEEIIGSTREVAVKRVYDFTGSDHDHINPLDISTLALIDLSKRYDLAIVTARHSSFEDNTSRWINRHFGSSIFSSMTHIGHPSAIENPPTKAEVCQELGAVALIDDSLEHVSGCAEAGIEGVLFGNYPWNQTDELPDGVTRRADWVEVLEHFDGRG